jgi:pyruvate/2-oxoglutarate dehydrogenase complex dihydrolipoamide dehydrogenase (E3) component
MVKVLKKVSLVVFFLALVTTTSAAEKNKTFYRLTIDASSPRLLKVEANFVLQDNLLYMDEAGAEQFPKHWANFVQNVKIKDAEGNLLAVEELPDAQWKVKSPINQKITLSYEVVLKHDDYEWAGGIDGIAFARDWGVFYAGRTFLILNGRKSAKFAHQTREAERYGFQKLEPTFLDDSFASITDRVQKVISVIEHHDAPEVFEEMGVEVVFGSPRFMNPQEIEVSLKDTEEMRVMKAKRFCISTGSRPFVPPIEGLHETGFITNEQIFDLKELPKRLIVLGGGAIGVELGQAFARFGSNVTIVEMAERILTKEDEEVSALMEKLLRGEGIDIRTRTEAVKVRRLADGSKVVTVESGGETFEIEADEILAAVGRSPNLDGLDLEKAGVEFDKKQIKTNDYLQTSQKHIFSAGDVTGHFQFTHMADYEAQIVIQNAFVPWPFKKKTDFRVVPWATFTEPEVARVGMIEAEAREKFGDGVKIYKVSFTENDRAQTESSKGGFAKVVTDKGRIIGATLIGEHAGELIHEFVWAMKEKLKVTDLNKIIRVYPTLAKIVQAVGTEATLENLRSPFVQKWFGRYLKFWRSF